VVDSKGVEQKAYNLPVGAHLMVNDGEKIKAGKVLIKILENLQKQGISQEVYQELPNYSKREILLILL
jgi:hypothetical protein